MYVYEIVETYLNFKSLFCLTETNLTECPTFHLANILPLEGQKYMLVSGNKFCKDKVYLLVNLYRNRKSQKKWIVNKPE